MVKKRLFLLVLLHVASILINSPGTDADDGLADPIGYYDEDGNYVYYDDQGYFDEDGNFYFYNPPMGYYNDEGNYVYFDNDGNDNNGFVDENGNVFYFDPPKGYFNDEGYYYYYDEEYNFEDYTPEVIVVTRTVRYTKTTTTSEPLTCEEHPQIIEAKEMVLSEPMEGFTHDQCEFIIIDEFCAWEYRCGAIITEPPPPEEDEEDEDEDYDYGDPEECETDKQVKFDNCFLKIRGLIKKKQPKRCNGEESDYEDDDDDDNNEPSDHYDEDEYEYAP